MCIYSFVCSSVQYLLDSFLCGRSHQSDCGLIALIKLASMPSLPCSFLSTFRLASCFFSSCFLSFHSSCSTSCWRILCHVPLALLAANCQRFSFPFLPVRQCPSSSGLSVHCPISWVLLLLFNLGLSHLGTSCCVILLQDGCDCFHSLRSKDFAHIHAFLNELIRLERELL